MQTMNTWRNKLTFWFDSTNKNHIQLLILHCVNKKTYLLQTTVKEPKLRIRLKS